MKILFIALLSWIAWMPMSIANAAPVQEVALSTNTCDTVAVSSASPATSMVNDGDAGDYTSLFLINHSTSARMYCSDSVNVSSMTTYANLVGIPLDKASANAVGGSVTITLFPGEKWYCVNDSGVGKYRMTRCRIR